ncbi:hypothetical protein D1007_04392 [Hordeum vulgare]|nr:hypothetical protein D1007_04392 [Hordeum vulgare]
MAGGFPNKGRAPLYPRAISPPPSSHQPRRRVSVLMHQARWHWKHRVSLPYPDVTLPNGWHLDPERILVSVVSQSARVHAEEPEGPPPPPPVVSDEDQKVEAAYQAALVVVLRDNEEEAEERALAAVLPPPPAQPAPAGQTTEA